MPWAVQDAGGGGREGSVGLEMADAACPVSLCAHRYNACLPHRVMLSLGKHHFGAGGGIRLPCAGGWHGALQRSGKEQGAVGGQPHSSRGFAELCACFTPAA